MRNSRSSTIVRAAARGRQRAGASAAARVTTSSGSARGATISAASVVRWGGSALALRPPQATATSATPAVTTRARTEVFTVFIVSASATYDA
jgi:hypothetical protein